MSAGQEPPDTHSAYENERAGDHARRLASFDAVRLRLCVKCNSSGPWKVEYRRNGCSRPACPGFVQEHLHVICACGHQTAAYTADHVA